MYGSVMLGSRCAIGPGGRNCACCGQAPGKPRKQARRSAKRAERSKWRKELRFS